MTGGTAQPSLAAVMRMLANPAVKGELRTRLEKVLKLSGERATLQGAMAKQGGGPETVNSGT